jgi:hypothetical protein
MVSFTGEGGDVVVGTAAGPRDAPIGELGTLDRRIMRVPSGRAAAAADEDHSDARGSDNSRSNRSQISSEIRGHFQPALSELADRGYEAPRHAIGPERYIEAPREDGSSHGRVRDGAAARVRP